MYLELSRVGHFSLRIQIIEKNSVFEIVLTIILILCYLFRENLPDLQTDEEVSHIASELFTSIQNFALSFKSLLAYPTNFDSSALLSTNIPFFVQEEI